MEKSEQVFIGEVISADTTQNIYDANGRLLYVFTLKIIEHFKNDIDTSSPFRTFIYSGPGSCQSVFKIGAKYLIYANQITMLNLLSSSDCSRTEVLENVSLQEINTLKNLYKKYLSKNLVNNTENIEILIDEDKNYLKLMALEKTTSIYKVIILLLSIFLMISIFYIKQNKR